MKLDTKALSLTLAILAGAIWLLAMVFSLITGIGERTLATLGSYHLFFSYSWWGMIVIVVEHFIGGYIVGWIFASLYNKLLAKKAPEQP